MSSSSARAILINGRVAGSKAFVLKPDFTHDLKAICGEIPAKLVERDACARCHATAKRGAGDDALGAASLHFCTLLASPKTTRSR
jgi:hypothetical protein